MGYNFTPDPTVDLNQNKGPGLMVVAIVLPSLSTFIVCIRLYVRLFVVRSCGRDDYLILASSVSPMVLSQLDVFSFKIGHSYHGCRIHNNFYILGHGTTCTHTRPPFHFRSNEMVVGVQRSSQFRLLPFQALGSFLPAATGSPQKDSSFYICCHRCLDYCTDLLDHYSHGVLCAIEESVELACTRNLLATACHHHWPLRF
jgi:hypothetical protein